MKKIVFIIGVIMPIIVFSANSLTNIETIAVIGKAIIGMSMIN